MYYRLLHFRFVRSVIRVFVVFNIEMSPNQSKKKSLQASTQPLQRCKRVFQALINVAIEELCETANALLGPVRFGVARPTSAFAASTSSSSSAELVSIEELFSTEPMAPRAAVTTASSGAGSASRSQQQQQLQQQLSGIAGSSGGDPRRSRNNSVGDQPSGTQRNRG